MARSGGAPVRRGHAPLLRSVVRGRVGQHAGTLRELALWRPLPQQVPRPGRLGPRPGVPQRAFDWIAILLEVALRSCRDAMSPRMCVSFLQPLGHWRRRPEWVLQIRLQRPVPAPANPLSETLHGLSSPSPLR
eukprot:4298101-Heterocapsa_arctica.AAC.1